MSPHQLIKHFGGVSAAARALGIKSPSVSGWLAAGRVPVDRQCQAEIITGGRLVADRDELNMQTSQVCRAQPAAWNGRERRQMRG